MPQRSVFQLLQEAKHWLKGRLHQQVRWWYHFIFEDVLDTPSPVSKNVYTQYNEEICENLIAQARISMEKARDEIREHYGTTSKDDIIDVLISCDGTWQKRGFCSLYGAVFIIATKPA